MSATSIKFNLLFDSKTKHARVVRHIHDLCEDGLNSESLNHVYPSVKSDVSFTPCNEDYDDFVDYCSIRCKHGKIHVTHEEDRKEETFHYRDNKLLPGESENPLQGVWKHSDGGITTIWEFADKRFTCEFCGISSERVVNGTYEVGEKRLLFDLSERKKLNCHPLDLYLDSNEPDLPAKIKTGVKIVKRKQYYCAFFGFWLGNYEYYTDDLEPYTGTGFDKGRIMAINDLGDGDNEFMKIA